MINKIRCMNLVLVMSQSLNLRTGLLKCKRCVKCGSGLRTDSQKKLILILTREYFTDQMLKHNLKKSVLHANLARQSLENTKLSGCVLFAPYLLVKVVLLKLDRSPSQ